MRLVINFSGEGITIPYNHSYNIYSAILKTLKIYFSQTSFDIHDKNESYIPKFCMSQLLPGGKRLFMKEGMIADRFILLISSPYEDILEKIKISLENEKKLKLFGNYLNLYSIKFENPKVSSEIITVITRSPIILKDKQTYITSNSEYFHEFLKNNIVSKYMKKTGKIANIYFIRILEHKEKLLEVKGGMIPGSMVKFTIGADYDVLETIMQLGIGSKTQIGFGFVEEDKRSGIIMGEKNAF